MTFDTAVCSWPTDYADCGPCEALSSLPASGIQRFEQMAAEFLWNWTGRQFGVCQVTIDLCREDCTEGQSTYNGGGSLSTGPVSRRWTPVLIGGTWHNIGCGNACLDKCGCGEETIRIPGPVDTIVAVIENGVVLDPASYHVNNYNTLVRTDGQQWRDCGTSITYTRGIPAPIGGQIAAGKLACELAKAVCGDATCALPKRVQSVTRQGVTVAMMLDQFEDLDKGKTGIWLIDSWVASVIRPDIGFSMASPDLRPRARRRTSSNPNFYGGGY
jgi:hypothetical protein